MSFHDDLNNNGYELFPKFRKNRDDYVEEPIMKDPGFKNFFKLFGRKISKILSLNITLIVGNFPIFFLFLVISGYLSQKVSAPMYPAFLALNGALTHGGNAFTSAILGTYSMQGLVTNFSTADYVFMALTGLLIFTYGPTMVGCTYNVRNLVRQDPVFWVQDFFYAIKKNIKQALIFGIMDIILVALIVYDVIFFNINYSQGFMMAVMFFLAIVIAILYFFMRMYVYIMMVTFDLSIPKLLKNAFIFSILGIKRNLMALLGTVIVVGLNVYLLFLYFPLGVVLPFVITLAVCLYISVYCAYPVIYKYMMKDILEPEEGDGEEEEETDSEDEKE